jgi:hypothetical protein
MSFGSDDAHDLFENAFYYYVKALRVLSHDAETQQNRGQSAFSDFLGLPIFARSAL